MFGVGDAGYVVVDHRLVEVEGQAIVHVALDGVGGDELYVGRLTLDLPGERTGGVVDVKVFAVEAEKEDKGRQDRKQGRIAYLGDSPAADDEEDNGPKREGRDCGGNQPLHRGDEGLVLHVLGGEDENEGHDCAERGV